MSADLYLDALTAEDCETVRVWRNLDRSHLRTPFPIPALMQQEFYRNVANDRHSPHRYYAVRKAPQANGGELLGMVGLTNLSWENGTAEISLIVRPDMKRRGVGTETVRLVLVEAFLRYGLRNVFGEVYFGNDAVEFWEKLVERYDGYRTWLPCRKFWNGVSSDSLYFGWLWGVLPEERRRAESTGDGSRLVAWVRSTMAPPPRHSDLSDPQAGELSQ